MSKKLTLVVLDSSGSMSRTAAETVTTVNNYIDELKAIDPEQLLTLVTFNDVYSPSPIAAKDHTNIVFAETPLAEAPRIITRLQHVTETFIAPVPDILYIPKEKTDTLTQETLKTHSAESNTWIYSPAGNTPLCDVIMYSTSILTPEYLAEKDINPETLTVVIMTDGHENASTEFIPSQVREYIESSSFAFIYLGANQDAIATAAMYGISRERALDYRPDMASLASPVLARLTTQVGVGPVRISALERSVTLTGPVSAAAAVAPRMPTLTRAVASAV